VAGFRADPVFAVLAASLMIGQPDVARAQAPKDEIPAQDTEATVTGFAGDRLIVSPARPLWNGRTGNVMSVPPSAAVKLLGLDVAVAGTTRLGYPAHLVFTIGWVELACLLVYVIPRTAPIGALLLTAYLGGATATQVRVEDPWFLFPAAIGVVIWGALWTRDPRIAAIVGSKG